jgi:DNA-binding response OmpR family regulator
VLKVLLIDKDETLGPSMAEKFLGRWTVHQSLSREATLRELTSWVPDVIILEPLLSGDGIALAELLRMPSLLDVPVVVLSGDDSESSKLAAFDAGATDYITKPFSFAELAARIAVRVKQTGRFELAGFVLDPVTQTVCCDGKSVPLAPLEFRVLAFLAKCYGRSPTREEIKSAAWGPCVHVLDRSVDSQIAKVRKKIVNSGMTIVSARGVGYELVLLSDQEEERTGLAS